MDFTPNKIGIPSRPYNGRPEIEEKKSVPNAQANFSINKNSSVNPPNQIFQSPYSKPQSANINLGGKIQLPPREYISSSPNISNDKNYELSKIIDHFNAMRKKVNDNLKNSINLLIKQAEEELLSIDKLENIMNEQLNVNSKLRATILDPDLLKYKDFALNSVCKIEPPPPVVVDHGEKKQLLASVPPPAKNHDEFHIKLMSVYSDTTVIYSTNLKDIAEINPPGFVKGMDAILLSKDSIFYANHNCSYKFNVATKTINNYKGFSYKRTYFAMTTFNKKPIVIGGIINSRSTNTVEIFKNNSWVKFESLQYPKTHPRAIQYQSCLYVFGGIEGGYLLDIEKYSGSWNLLEVEMPVGMKYFGLCPTDNGIYIFGGEDKEEVFSDIYIFNPHNESFSSAELDESFTFLNNESVYYDGTDFYLLDNVERRIIVY